MGRVDRAGRVRVKAVRIYGHRTILFDTLPRFESVLRESITRTDALSTFSAQLTGKGIENAHREVQWLIQELLGISRIELIAHPGEKIPSRQISILERAVERRITGEPLQYILGSASFYGREFRVDPSVLIPRPETEMLVDWAVTELRNRPCQNVLDLGTGSGCIPISVKLEVVDAECIGVDISEDALNTARKNALALEADVAFVHGDMLSGSGLNSMQASVDVLLSNPPYIALHERDSLESQVKDHEPAIALFSGNDPLIFYQALTRCAAQLLTATGIIGVEVHADHGEEVFELFKSCGLNDVKMHRDLAQKNRMVTAGK